MSNISLSLSLSLSLSKNVLKYLKLKTTLYSMRIKATESKHLKPEWKQTPLPYTSNDHLFFSSRLHK
jgi:hypothetical protein